MFSARGMLNDFFVTPWYFLARKMGGTVAVPISLTVPWEYFVLKG